MESPKSEAFKNFPIEKLPTYYYEHILNVLEIIDGENFYNPETIKLQVNPIQIDNKFWYIGWEILLKMKFPGDMSIDMYITKNNFTRYLVREKERSESYSLINKF